MRKIVVSEILTKIVGVIFLSIVLVTAGCSQQEVSPSGQEGNLIGELMTSPNPPSARKPTQFTLSLKDRAGQPVSDAKVELHLEMKEMDHGRNVVEMKPANTPGKYTGIGKFAMDQTWEVYARIQSAKQNATLKFQVQVQP